jgi:putative sterol carrier protein
MATPFPSSDWLEALVKIINHDGRYAQVAKNWEGDIFVVIDPDGTIKTQTSPVAFYLDLWHGTCRSSMYFDPLPNTTPEARFVFQATMNNIMKIFGGELDPMQAMLTRRLHVDGSMGYLLRNVPTVLDFIRCCRLVPLAPEAAA